MNPRIFFAKYPSEARWAWIKIQAYDQARADQVASSHGCGPTITVNDMRQENYDIYRDLRTTVPIKQ